MRTDVENWINHASIIKDTWLRKNTFVIEVARGVAVAYLILLRF